MTLAHNILKPHEIERTGDNSPASSLYAFVFRMSGWWRQAIAAALAILIAVLAMVPLELQRIIIDDVIADGDVRLLMVLGGVYLLVVIVQQAIKFSLLTYQGWIGESATRYAREHLSQIYRDTENDLKPGSAAGVIRTEIDQLGAFVGQSIADPLVNAGRLAALFGYMLVVEPFIAVVSVLFFLPQVIALPLIQARINRLIDRRVGMLRRLSNRVHDVEFTRSSGWRWRHFKRRLDLIHYNRMRMFILKYASKAMVNGLNALAPLSALIVGGWLVIEGETTIGVVVAFINGFERMADPLRELIAFYREAALSKVRHARIAQWMKDVLQYEGAPQRTGRAN